MSVAILGAGAFGTGLAIALAREGREVMLWARDGAEAMQGARENARRLPGHAFPKSLSVTGDLGAIESDLLLIAVPTQQLHRLIPTIPNARYALSCAKGIHRISGLSPAALIAALRPDLIPGALTGPSFAVDIARGLPTALTLACASDGEALQARLSTPTLRLYRSTDLIGAELGGALKNVIAIAAGVVIGAGLGESARAALMARGFAEMRRVAKAKGARDETLAGLSGFGDLVLTCSSDKSRNYRYGLALAGALPLEEGATVEGRATAEELACNPALDTPIADAVAGLSAGRLTVQDAIDAALSRPLKPE